ncbi:unnamed protein product [Closterium sp. NIES-65]|nr:unnamed protein product [Closterium sp. NIES-65]
MDGGASLGPGAQLFLLTLLASSVSPVRCVTLANSQALVDLHEEGWSIQSPSHRSPRLLLPATSLRLRLPPPPSVYPSLHLPPSTSPSHLCPQRKLF